MMWMCDVVKRCELDKLALQQRVVEGVRKGHAVWIFLLGNSSPSRSDSERSEEGNVCCLKLCSKVYADS